jgi:CheY-like chemotaxis protein
VLRFEIEDTGIGIPSDRLTRLFHSFSQVDASTTRRFGGSGLGLAICKKIVEAMGGRIGVESQAGRGSTFWFTLALEVQAEDAKRERERLAAGVRDQRILVVDDNATNRRVACAHLGAWGFQFEEASTPNEALDRLRTAAARGQPFLAALLDYQMPEMDGIELGRRIKADAELRATHLLLLTSVGHLGHSEIARSVGFARYLTKPIKPSFLFDALIGSMCGAGSVGTAEPGADAPPGPAGAGPLAGDRALRILVAEDNVVNQRVALRTLERQGHRAVAVGNGVEVLRALELAPYDLILMDCQMPEMDGFEATREIRRREPPDRRIPILAMTANALQGAREECLAAGMDDYIAKPVRPRDLAAALERWLRPREVA